MEPAAGNAPASSALQKRRDYLSIHAGKKWRKPEGMLPIRSGGRSVFETVPARLSGSTSNENGESPRCRPVLCGLRDRCIAAMLATRRSGSQWSCSTTSMSRSVRLPTGGGTPLAVRFNFQEKWSLRLDSHQHLTAYETAALLYATERKNSIRQPDLRRPLPVTNGVRRFLRFGGF